MTDWLDDVLQQRPVDDDGFSARVVRVATTQRRTTVLRAFVIALVVLLLVPGSWLVVGWIGANAVERLAWNDEAALDGGSWLAAHRGQFRAALTKLDRNPALARRTGADAGPLLDELLATGNTALFAQLGSYAVWTRTHTTDSWALLALARKHLSTAIDAPLVEGQPAPFPAAARDIEAFGRLWLTNNGSGAEAFTAVRAATQKARDLQRDGGFVPALSDDEAAALSAVWFMADAFASPAASDDDLAFLQASTSVLTCNVARHAEQDRRLAGFLDDRLIERRAAFTQTGCGTRLHTVEPCSIEDAETDDALCVAIAIARVSPWKRIVREQQSLMNPMLNTFLSRLPPEAR